MSTTLPSGASDAIKELVSRLGLRYVDLESEKPDPEVLELAPGDFALKHQILPIYKDGGQLFVAIGAMSSLAAVDDLAVILGIPTVPVAADPALIRERIEEKFLEHILGELSGDDGSYIMQGDNRDTPDQFDIGIDDVRGQQRAHVPKVGLLMGVLSQVWFLAILVGLFVILQLWPEDDEHDDEDEHTMTGDEHTDGLQPVELTGAADDSDSYQPVEPVEPVVATTPRRSRVRARVVVDGDSVVRFAWPTLSADDAQQRCADASNLVGIRFGTVVAVALANADAAPSDGSHTTVIVAPHPQTMRELLHDHVGQFNGELTVVVVTDDASVRADALEQGASTLSAAQWLDFVDS